MSARAWWVLGWLLQIPLHVAGQAPEGRLREPSVSEVVRLAKQAAQLTSPERTRALARRDRLAGLVPTLKLGAERGLKQDLSASSDADSERTNQSLGDDL